MEQLVELSGISRSFPASAGLFRSKQRIQALQDIQLAIKPGEILAILGESGSGKSTLGRILSRLEEPESGDLIVRGKVQMIFQDPFASLNPVHSVGYHVKRSLVLHGGREEEAAEILEAVGLKPGSAFLGKFPFELSGGQRQRVAIARALATRPSLLIADEPTSMLDVSIRMDILNLLKGLRESHRLAILLITHDLPSAFYLSDRIVVMYAGQIVESGTKDEIFKQPAHPYTQLLWHVARQPIAEARVQASTPAKGACTFAARCPKVTPLCLETAPKLIGDDQRKVRCHDPS